MTLPKGFGTSGNDSTHRYAPRIPKEKLYPTGQCIKCGHSRNAHKTLLGLMKTHCIACMCPQYHERYSTNDSSRRYGNTSR